MKLCFLKWDVKHTDSSLENDIIYSDMVIIEHKNKCYKNNHNICEDFNIPLYIFEFYTISLSCFEIK